MNVFGQLIAKALEDAGKESIPAQLKLRGDLSPSPISGEVSLHPEIEGLVNLLTPMMEQKSLQHAPEIVAMLNLSINVDDIIWAALSPPIPIDQKPNLTV